MSLIVFGSINMDLVAQTTRLPRKSETVLGKNFFIKSGGKGANQAVAAAKLGIETYMIGRVGDDDFGITLLNSLKEANVNTDNVRVTQNTCSGVAIIAVDENSDNNIIVIPGANGCVDGTDVERLKLLLPKASALLLQLEVPIKTIIKAALEAKTAGVKVILDPAPAPDTLPDELYSLVDVITPNETEASRLVGFEINNEETYLKAAEIFLNKNINTAVLKLGAKGVFCATRSEHFIIPAFKITPVDTVAAGDAFNGAMAAAMDRGLSLRDAMTWGAAAGALAATQQGAQSSLPSRAIFEDFLRSNSVRIGLDVDEP
ncbi:ribokinase [Aphanothece hegewaldii CCALA 016]|uniref:Ribokinase n=1 Tax=Aphanothece hegewaldii CCALA 016 TaxID=2107694 RepID=A0A2T1LX59_9CHRO|nr:ribokinase [Aphanothece hegewaldii]PSF36766.1 ribokinase [Aphanothece hegewaldii CCALA 016]